MDGIRKDGLDWYIVIGLYAYRVSGRDKMGQKWSFKNGPPG